jgi:xanthine dehydrogenase accessory factor
MDNRDRKRDGPDDRTRAYEDNILPDLAGWIARGERCALITLTGVDGNAPRAAGAQMAVSETGRWAGYISGGCLEQAIAMEAVEAIEAGKPRMVRYGRGSPYLDIRLPCGSGLDIFIQPIEDVTLIQDMHKRLDNRQPFALRMNLTTGALNLEAVAHNSGGMYHPLIKKPSFLRVYTPPLRCLIVGSSPIAVKLAELAACAGFDTVFYAPDVETSPAMHPDIRVVPLLPEARFEADPWTAAVLAFHDHDQELPVLRNLLLSPCFFLAAIGSRNAHEARKRALAGVGFSDRDIARIQSPAGLVQGLKSAPLVALSILAQVVAAARERQIVF